MAVKNNALTIVYKAYNTITRAGESGDEANHTLKLVQDGGAASAPSNSPAEIDAVNLPGDYKILLTAAELNYDVTCLAGKSSTSDVLIFPVQIFTEGLKDTEVVLCYYALDVLSNTGKTGDDANHTLRLVVDGVLSTPGNAPAEVDAVNTPGLYKITITAGENSGNVLALSGESSTSYIEIIPVQVYPYSLPATPAITAAVDNGDEDAITVTVTGTGTVQLYYRIAGESSWTTGETRSGSGDIVQTGLTAGNWYELYLVDTVGGIASAPSPIVTVEVLSSFQVMENAVVAKLKADATIASLVSARVYPNVLPQDAIMPALTYQVITGIRENQMDGAAGISHGSIQINAWDDDYEGAKTLAEAVRKELNCYHGETGGVRIYDIFLMNEMDLAQIAEESEQLKRFAKILEFSISYSEDVN
jgi:hypothetical protein